MPGGSSPTYVLTLVLFFSAIVFTTPVLARVAYLDKEVVFSIPKQPLYSALIAFSRQAAVQVIIAPGVPSIAQSSAVYGKSSVRAGLDALLTGSGLKYDTMGDSVSVLAFPVDLQYSSLMTSPLKYINAVSNMSGEVINESETLEVEGAPQESSETKSHGPDGRRPLDEVLVTAQKREERLQDTPVSIAAISSDVLTQTNQTRLQDYYSSIPGFSFVPGINAGANVAIRGIASNGGTTTAPTVAMLLDDIPFGGATSVLSNTIPEIDPSDLNRIEALRGPQGTLYGASSMGGLLKYVTVDPRTDVLSGRVQADVNGVQNGAQAGYGFRGSLNIPISEVLAVRASAFTRRDPGYIDNVFLKIDGANVGYASGGRFAALWRPSEAVNLKVGALYQDARADSNIDEQPALGKFKQSYIADCCGYESNLQLYSANLTIKLGAVDFTSVSGYMINDLHTFFDATYLVGDFSEQIFPGFSGVGDQSQQITRRFTQELRASMPIGDRIDWLVGGFYEHEIAGFYSNAPAVNPLTGAVAGSLDYDIIPTKYIELAAFTDVTVHFTDRFNIQFGGRESHIQQIEETGSFTGPLDGGTIIIPPIDSSTNVFTYLVTPQFKFSPDLMAYARIASGYRPGTFNAFNPDPLIPRTANPDKTENYEIGVKAQAPTREWSVDASLYYIAWKGIQTGLPDLNVNPVTGAPYNVAYTSNAGRAKSQGVEISAETRPIGGLTLSGWLTYTDAVLTQGFPLSTNPTAPYGPTGSRLPFSSRYSGSASISQTFRVLSDVTGTLGATASYVGARLGQFNTVALPQRPFYPGYTKLDVHTSLDFGSWSANLWAGNLAGRRGLIGGGVGELPPDTLRYIPPRTFGLSLAKTF